MRAIALISLLATACRITGTFDCERDDQCRHGTAAGSCTPDGCAFGDSECPSGYRYDDSIDEIGGTCVETVAPPPPPGCAEWKPNHFDPCALPVPLGPLSLAGATYQYDTDTGDLRGGPALAPASVAIPQIGTGGGVVRVMSIDGLTIEVDASLIVTGTLPLVIASWSDIRISGVVAVRSSTTSVGAGANPTSCAAAGAGAGLDAQGVIPASGGGGGAGQGSGGAGGTADDGGTFTVVGGVGGMATPKPLVIRGGCPGAPGGHAGSEAIPPALPTTIATGGSGGGALQLTARTTIIASGAITANGGGGNGSPMGAGTGGGGGGAGGYLGLEAPMVRASNLTANGGGGGGGSGPLTVGGGGAAGAGTATTSSGGAGGGCASGGGAGGGGTTQAGATAGGSSCATGGGGGGVGYILIRSPMFVKPPMPAPIISPVEIVDPT